MRPIPLNFQTLYADLAQNVDHTGGELAGSVRTKTVKGKSYLFVVFKDGAKRRQKSLGPAGDPEAQRRAIEARHANERYQARKSTVSALKQQGRLPAPTIAMGRVLETVSNAGLFDAGVVLVGTTAFQTYPPIVGYYMPSGALLTNDADLLVAPFSGHEPIDIGEVLKRADPSFEPKLSPDDILPCMFQSKSGLRVDILTKFRRGRNTPVVMRELGCSAEALKFMEYLAEESMEAVALYGGGVPVRVPPPLRYAVHNLLIAQQRPARSSAKKRKDLAQARELIDIYLEIGADELESSLDEARDRGRRWKTAINASLREMGRTARQGSLPLPVEPRKKAR